MTHTHVYFFFFCVRRPCHQILSLSVAANPAIRWRASAVPQSLVARSTLGLMTLLCVYWAGIVLGISCVRLMGFPPGQSSFPIHSLWVLELDVCLSLSKVGLLVTDPLTFLGSSSSLSLHVIFLFLVNFIFFTSYSSLPCHILLALVISKLDLVREETFQLDLQHWQQ